MRARRCWIRVALHLLAGAVAGAAIFAVGVPLLIYGYGLGVAPGHPTPAESPASQSWKLEAWRQVERSDRIEVRPMTPWTWLRPVADRSFLEEPWPGARASGWIAKRYVHETAGRLPNWKWQMATHAETVWITRHWSEEEIATEVAGMERRRRDSLD